MLYVVLIGFLAAFLMGCGNLEELRYFIRLGVITFLVITITVGINVGLSYEEVIEKSYELVEMAEASDFDKGYYVLKSDGGYVVFYKQANQIEAKEIESGNIEIITEEGVNNPHMVEEIKVEKNKMNKKLRLVLTFSNEDKEIGRTYKVYIPSA